MAVSIQSLNGLNAIKNVGIKQSLFDWLQGSPIHVVLSATAFIFNLPEDFGIDPPKVPVTLAKLQGIASGKISPAEKGELRMKLETLITSLYDIYGDELAKYDPSVAKKMNTVAVTSPLSGALGKLPPLEVPLKTGPGPAPKEKEMVMVEAKPKWSEYPVAKMKHGPQVPLREATMMYQPVLSTSPGSRYYLVGACDDIRVAARYASGSLSIRIEGPQFAKHIPALNANGFTSSVAKGYASMHLAINDADLARKTLGAVLMGLGVPLETPLPNFQKVLSAC